MQQSYQFVTSAKAISSSCSSIQQNKHLNTASKGFSPCNLSLPSTLKNEPGNLSHNITKVILQRKMYIYTIAWSDWVYAFSKGAPRMTTEMIKIIVTSNIAEASSITTPTRNNIVVGGRLVWWSSTSTKQYHYLGNIQKYCPISGWPEINKNCIINQKLWAIFFMKKHIC